MTCLAPQEQAAIMPLDDIVVLSPIHQYDKEGCFFFKVIPPDLFYHRRSIEGKKTDIVKARRALIARLRKKYGKGVRSCDGFVFVVSHPHAVRVHPCPYRPLSGSYVAISNAPTVKGMVRKYALHLRRETPEEVTALSNRLFALGLEPA